MKYILSLVILLLNVAAATGSGRPQLVVGIIADGLDYDMLMLLKDNFGPDGINRLLRDGAVFEDVTFGSNLDGAAAATTLMTGAPVAVHGISGNTRFDPETRRAHDIFDDPSQIGNFTDRALSAAGINVSTLSDEVRVDANGLGSVYAIAADPSLAIALGGHAANNACWLTDDTGKWATSAYYKDLPTPLQTLNHRYPLSARLDTITWAPLLDGSRYPSLPSYKRIYQFRYSFGRSNPDRYRMFKQSAMANREVTDLAVNYMKAFTPGTRESVDMLNLGYTLQPYRWSRESDVRAEQYDLYVRLDRDLARLFKTIDSHGPGMDKTLVFLAGTPVHDTSAGEDPKWQIPSGQFSPLRAISLLKVDLMSIFGNGDWVSGYHDGQVFLNRAAIKEHGKDLKQMRAEAADFMRRLSGVAYAATIDEVMAAGDDESPFPPARNIDVDTAGDLFVAVAPGWTVTDDGNSTAVRPVRAATDRSAFIIYGGGVKPQNVPGETDARRLAPTVSRLLNIRKPNGASLTPIRL